MRRITPNCDGGLNTSSRSELGQVEDSEPPLQSCYLIYDLEEAFLPKKFIFLFFELFAERVVLVPGYNGAESRKQDCVFAGLMRAVHAQEGP